MPKARVKYKPGCSDPKRAHPAITKAIDAAAYVWGRWVSELWVTSLNDGQHSKTSWHYKDRAVDFRTHNLPVKARRQAASDLASVLGHEYDVLHEYEGTPNEHVHCEYDP